MAIVAPIVNFFIDLLVSIFDFIFGLLPETPFEFTPLSWGVFGDAVGYFLPIGTMVAHFALILGAVTLWYVVRWLLRWIKMIR